MLSSGVGSLKNVRTISVLGGCRRQSDDVLVQYLLCVNWICQQLLCSRDPTTVARRMRPDVSATYAGHDLRCEWVLALYVIIFAEDCYILDHP